MTINQLITLSHVFFTIGIITVIISVILYVKLDIYKALHIITGRKIKARVQIQNNEKERVSAELNNNVELENELDKTVVLQASETIIEVNDDKTIALGTFRIKKDIVYVHTSEII